MGTSAQQLWELYIVLCVAAGAAIVVHELGHLLACLAVRAEVRAFRLGDESTAINFRVRKVPVSLGWPYRGSVEYRGVFTVLRCAVITLAGPVADLALAGLALDGLAAVSGQRARSLMLAVALGFGATGIAALIPARLRSGRLSDGARLFELRSVVAASKQQGAPAPLCATRANARDTV